MDTMKSQLENFRYRADVDGLRALAVIPVIFFHASLGFPGGFVGVDIFFVISGYLITTIIAKEVTRGDFQMKNFWERRIRRILPAAVAMAVLVLIAGAFILLPYQFETLGKSSLAQTFMVSNFYFWQQDGYFAAPSDFEPLLHTWSLAVEEQFYVILPLILLSVTNIGTVRGARWIIILFIISLAWSIYGVAYYPAATFYLLPSRAWELLLGSIIAIVPIKLPKGRHTQSILSWVGLTLILVSFSSYSLLTPFPGLAAIPPVLGAGLLILVNRDTLTLPGKLLSLPPVVFIGKISYSLYLWHWPLLVFAKHLSSHETPLHLRWILVAASFIIGYLSWRFIETPFRKKSLLKGRQKAFKLFLVTTLVLGTIGTIIYKMEGLPKRFGKQLQAIASVKNEEQIVKDTKTIRQTGDLPLLGPVSNDKRILPVLIWGDSHAGMMLPLIRDLCQDRKVDLHYAVHAAHPPILDTNRAPHRPGVAAYNDAVMELVTQKRIKKIILIARWSKYCNASLDLRSPAITDREGSDRDPTEVFETYLTKMIKTLHEMGIQVIIMRQVPYQKRNPVELTFHAHRLDRDDDRLGVTSAEARAHHATANQIFDRLPKDQITIIDPSPYLDMENGHTRIHVGGLPIYSDENHLVARGSRLLRPIFEPIFDKFEKP